MNRSMKARHYRALQTVQWFAFALLAFVGFVLMTSGSHVQPILLIPLALCISAHFGEIPAAAVGVVSGLLMDIACGKLLGYNAIWMVTCCVIVSLLHSYYLRDKLLNILGLTAVCVAVQGYMDFMLYYAIWGHENVTLIYTHVMLPSGIMTLVGTIPVWLLVRWICRICGSRRSFELEKTIVTNQ